MNHDRTADFKGLLKIGIEKVRTKRHEYYLKIKVAAMEHRSGAEDILVRAQELRWDCMITRERLISVGAPVQQLK